MEPRHAEGEAVPREDDAVARSAVREPCEHRADVRLGGLPRRTPAAGDAAHLRSHEERDE